MLQYLYTGEYDFFGELVRTFVFDRRDSISPRPQDGAEDATEMLLHVDVFLITERIQIDHIPELAITKLTAAMRTASLFQLTTIMKVAYEHGIPSSAKGELLKSAFLQEAVPKSHALSELTAFNELLGEGGAFAQDFVKGLCNVHPKSTENGRLATAMGVRCEICYCPSCHYNWLNPSKAVRTDNKCPICTNSARVRVSAQVRLWKCSAASCTGAFFGAAPSGSQTYICPSCKKACLAVRPE